VSLPSGPCESDFMQVQVLLSAPYRSKGKLCSVFLCPKNIRPLPYSSFFTKKSCSLVCSVAGAFTTTHCHYELFARCYIPLIFTHYYFKKGCTGKCNMVNNLMALSLMRTIKNKKIQEAYTNEKQPHIKES